MPTLESQELACSLELEQLGAYDREDLKTNHNVYVYIYILIVCNKSYTKREICIYTYTYIYDVYIYINKCISGMAYRNIHTTYICIHMYVSVYMCIYVYTRINIDMFIQYRHIVVCILVLRMLVCKDCSICGKFRGT